MEQHHKPQQRKTYVCWHKNLYLCTLLNRLEYMRIPLIAFLEHIINQYNLREKAINVYVYVDIRRSIYGMPQAGALAKRA